MGELKQPRDYLQRAMEIKQNVLCPNHIEVATSCNNLGTVHPAMGELDQAKDYHQQAMEIKKKRIRSKSYTTCHIVQ